MDSQLELFASIPSDPKRRSQSVFLALFPDPATADRIIEQASHLRRTHGLTGRLRPVRHLHLSLHHLGRFLEVPPWLVSGTTEICEAITARVPPFEIALDRVLSFRSGKARRPFVLASRPDANPALQAFHYLLGEALARAGLSADGRASLTPHVTMLYDPQMIEEMAVETVGWRVSELALIGSHVGETKYDWLQRWELRG
jgi:RNA 2',3'-cyclic 3'-phosphodiesterase